MICSPFFIEEKKGEMRRIYIDKKSNLLAETLFLS